MPKPSAAISNHSIQSSFQREGPFVDGTPSRRDILMAMGGGGLALSLPPMGQGAHASSQILAGSVYEDVSGVGLRTARDPGVPGVLVSNGRDVTRTDRAGRWVLPHRGVEPVFIVKPADWKLSSRSRREARFWRDQSSADFDFALERATEPDQFDVLLVADTQASSRQELAYVRQDLLSAVRDTKAAFAIHHGDAMGDDLSLLPQYLDVLGETGLVWHHCPGNHDMDAGVKNSAGAFKTWSRLVGPTHYAFEYGRAVFIVLNNVEYVANPTWHSHKPYQGRIGPDQLHFVRTILAEVPNERLVVVSMHIPLASFGEPDNPTVTTVDRDELLQLLSPRPHAISFAGHSHTSEHHYLGEAEGFRGPRLHHHQVLTAACGSWWSGERDVGGVPVSDSRDGTPRGHHVLSVDGVEATTRFVKASADGPAQMRLMLCFNAVGGLAQAPSSGLKLLPVGRDAVIRQSDLSETVLVADVFDGGPRTDVSFELASAIDGNGDAQPMSPWTTVDPFVAECFQRSPQLCKPWVAACASSHIWATRIPGGLAVGSHTLRVSARNEFGKAHFGEINFAVEA